MKINEDIAKSIISLYITTFFLSTSLISNQLSNQKNDFKKNQTEFYSEVNNINDTTNLFNLKNIKSIEEIINRNSINDFYKKNIKNRFDNFFFDKEYDKKINNYNQLPEQLKKLDNLSMNEYVFWIDKNNPSLSVYQNTNKGLIKIEEFIASTGRNEGKKERRGDNKTPEGSFYIKSIENSSNWVHWSGKKNAYGPNFLRLETGFQGIGIHGTNEPHLLGKNVSEGCIRLSNENLIYLLENYANLGTKVIVSYTSPKIENSVISYNQGEKNVK
jgi:hypothetical protein